MAKYVVNGVVVYRGTVVGQKAGFDGRGKWRHDAWTALREEGTARVDEVLTEYVEPEAS